MKTNFSAMNDIYVEEGRSEYNYYKDFTSLKAWQKCREVKLFFYSILQFLPDEEKYNLNIQIRKSSISITSNIAEGYGRFNFQECIQFCRISKGSLYELKDHLISCLDLGYIDNEKSEEGFSLIEEAKKLVSGYINYQKQQKKNI